jgi:hypothetical protein
VLSVGANRGNVLPIRKPLGQCHSRASLSANQQ